MRRKIALGVLAAVSFGIGVAALAKPPGGGGGGGGGTQNCKIVVCAQCPEGYHLSFPQIWPNCCNCVPD